MRWINGLVCAILFLGASSSAVVASTGISSQDLGSLAVNAATPGSATLTFQISVSSPRFQLRYGKDFSLGQPACNTASPITCTVTVSFNPLYPGVREDAVQVLDNNGDLLSTMLLHGIGLAPQAVLRPGAITSFAGTGVLGFSGDNGPATSAKLSNPQGVAIDDASNVYIADSLAQVIRKVSVATGIITTVAGPANLNAPTGVAVDGAGNLYIADSQNNRIRKVDAVSGVITTVAGGGPVSSTLGDGNLATQASLDNPTDVAVDPVGNLYIADEYNGRIRRVDASTGVITTVAGGGTPGPGTDGIGDGGPAMNAVLSGPSSVAFDSSGNLYIADSGNNLIREVSNGIISVAAGNGAPAYSGDGGAAVQASLNQPACVRVDAAGSLYIADAHNNVIRQVNGAGIISTVAGQLNNPGGIAIDPTGNIYIADQGNSMVRKIVPGPAGLSFGAIAVGSVSSPQTISIANIGNQVLDIGGFSLTGGFLQQSSGTTDCALDVTVPPAASCSVAVAFAPQSASSLTGSLSLLTDSLNGASLYLQSVTLSGTGTGTGNASSDPAASTTNLVFPDQPAGVASIAQTVTLTNPGSATLSTPGFSISGSNALEFSIASTTCKGSLAGHGSCTVSVVFTPQAAGPRSATLSITETGTSAGTQFIQSVFLSGLGVVTPPVVSPATLNFSNSGTGSLPFTQTVTLTNPSLVALSIFSLSTSRPDLFSIGTTCQSSLAPLGSCTVSVTFTPTAATVTPATLNFTFSSGSSQVVTLTTANPVLVFTGSTSSLGPQTRELRSLPVSYGLQNLSGSPVTVNTVTIGGLNASDFAQVNNCGTSIPAGQGCMIWLTYSPTGSSPVSSSATIVVTDNAPGSPHSITVSGTATGLSQALIDIDSPQPGATVSGTIPLGGWVISNNAAITGVTLAVDGVILGPATYGINRPDVCAVFPARAGCPNVGWSSSLDTTTLADGAHNLTISAATVFGNTTIAVPFTVANWASSVIKTTRLNIDSPSSASTLTGVVTFRGWAIDDTTAIHSVSLAIDGVPVAAATYGVARPDVCVAFPGRAGCPNVGWNAAIDTRQFSNGSHTLAVTATTANGVHATIATSFQVANEIPSTILVCIDSPTSTPVSGILSAAGWAIDTSTTISSVSLSIDGVSQGTASSDSRPDVCDVFDNPQGCPSVGWNGSIDTTKLADGAHTLGVLATNSNSQSVTFLRPFTVSNLKNPYVKTTLVDIDLPSPAADMLSGVAEFAGWAIDQVTPIASVELAIDGVPSTSLQTSVSRPDVCVVFPGSAGCPLVGWDALFDTSSLGDGPHVLQVTATSQGGFRATRTANFVSSNAAQTASRGEVVLMDFPLSGTTVSGTVSISGWAVNKTSAVQTVVITVDGVTAGTAQYGTFRPDVCLVMQSSSNCPDVGWTYLLDTTFLSNGIHTLRAIECASNGCASTSRSVVVLNAPGSMLIDIDSPQSNFTYNGTFTLSGWVIDNMSAVKSVAVSIDGLPIAPAQYGINRPDVCAVFPGRAGCPNVGWSLSLDTTVFVNGSHTLQVSGISADNVRFTESLPFSIAN